MSSWCSWFPSVIGVWIGSASLAHERTAEQGLDRRPCGGVPQEFWRFPATSADTRPRRSAIRRFGLADFRARDDPRCPLVPAPDLEVKRGRILARLTEMDARAGFEVRTRRVRKLGRADLQGNSSAPPGAARVKVDAPIVGTHSPVRPEAEPIADGQGG